jgi:hypothetical protein
MKPNFKSTFFSLLGYGVTQTVAPTPVQLELLKQAMLDALTQRGCLNHPRLVRQIRYAADAEGLWYLRSDLMQALSDLLGEGAAYEELERVSLLFTRYLPQAMTRRAGRPRT